MIDYNAGEFEYMNAENYNRKRRAILEENPDARLPGITFNDEPSMTVPGEALSIKQIMERALNGISPQERQVEFFDQENFDRILEAPQDISDLVTMREELIDMSEAVLETINAKQAEADAESVQTETTDEQSETESQ